MSRRDAGMYNMMRESENEVKGVRDESGSSTWTARVVFLLQSLADSLSARILSSDFVIQEKNRL